MSASTESKLSMSTPSSSSSNQKILERTIKTHAKILISAKRGGGRGRGKSRRRRPRPQDKQKKSSSSSSSSTTAATKQKQHIDHQKRVNHIRNDKTQTLAQRKTAIERENFRFRTQQQQQQQQPQQQQQQQQQRIRRNTRDAKYTSRYMNQRRPRRYHRQYGSTVIVSGGNGGRGMGIPYISGGGGGAAGMGGYGSAPYYDSNSMREMPYGPSSNNTPYQQEQSLSNDFDENNEGSSSVPSIIDTEPSQRILNTTSLHQTHLETSSGEFRNIPALENVDVDVVNEYLKLRDAFDKAETPDDRIEKSVAFALFTLKIDRIFKTHAEVYVRAMKYRPAIMSIQDVEAIIDALSREEVDQIALLSNEEIRLFLLN